jgi:hypothetical protein
MRNSDGTFLTGHSGNPSGRPAIVSELQKLARTHTLATLVEIMSNAASPPNARVTAASLPLGLLLRHSTGPLPRFGGGPLSLPLGLLLRHSAGLCPTMPLFDPRRPLCLLNGANFLFGLSSSPNGKQRDNCADYEAEPVLKQHVCDTERFLVRTENRKTAAPAPSASPSSFRSSAKQREEGITPANTDQPQTKSTISA